LNPIFADPFKEKLIECLEQTDNMITTVAIQIMINMITKKNVISLLNFIFKSQNPKTISNLHNQAFHPVIVKIIEKINELSQISSEMNDYF